MKINIEGTVNILTCKYCKYYVEYILDAYKNDKRMKCARMQSTDDTPDDVDTLAYASDYEGYHADVLVRENFGCVMWEKKNES